MIKRLNNKEDEKWLYNKIKKMKKNYIIRSKVEKLHYKKIK